MDFQAPQNPQNQGQAMPPANPAPQQNPSPQGPSQRPRLNIQNVAIVPPKSHAGLIASVVVIVLIAAGIYVYEFQPSLFNYLLSIAQIPGNNTKLQAFSGAQYGFNYYSGWHTIAQTGNGTSLTLNGVQNVTITVLNQSHSMPALFIGITATPSTPFINSSALATVPLIIYGVNSSLASKAIQNVSGTKAFEDSAYNITAVPSPSFIKAVAFASNNVSYVIVLVASGSRNIPAGNSELDEVLNSFKIK